MSTVVDAVRRLGAHPRVEPLTALLLRAGCVHGSARFVAREATRRRGVAAYRVRGSTLRVLVRHGTPDVVTLGEVFHRPDYDPPAAVAERLPGAPRILDLGANAGYFGAYAFGRWPAATVEAFEPDPANAALLERCVALNRLADRWRVQLAAAGAHDGSLAFVAGEFATSHAAAAGEDATTEVPLLDVLPRLEGVDLLKMDIEGGEWAILLDERFADVRPLAMVFEYHPQLSPDPDPARAVAARMDELGYATHSVFERPDGHGLVWAWTA